MERVGGPCKVNIKSVLSTALHITQAYNITLIMTSATMLGDNESTDNITQS